MKRMILVVLAVCALVALMSGVAFANSSGTGSYVGTEMTGLTWVDYGVAGQVYGAIPGNPHSGFTVATHQCTVCHSVHHAATAGEALLPDTVANACIYCHVTNDTGYIQIYNGNQAAYETASSYGHDAGTMAAGCTDCHQVHAAKTVMVSDPTYGTGGAGTAMEYMVEKLLKVDGSGTDMVGSDGVALSLAAGTPNGVAVSYWCTTCHRDNSNTAGYYNPNQSDGTNGGWTHVMRAPTNAYTTSSGDKGTIASATSATCWDCHNRAEVNAVQTQGVGPGNPYLSQFNFPHYSDGIRFLTSATALDGDGVPTAAGAATDSHADGVCINCHRGATVSGSGVGISW